MLFLAPRRHALLRLAKPHHAVVQLHASEKLLVRTSAGKRKAYRRKARSSMSEYSNSIIDEYRVFGARSA